MSPPWHRDRAFAFQTEGLGFESRPLSQVVPSGTFQICQSLGLYDGGVLPELSTKWQTKQKLRWKRTMDLTNFQTKLLALRQ